MVHNALINMSQHAYCLDGCKTAVPNELGIEKLCVLHFTWRVERDYGHVRREISTEKLSAARALEIQTYVKFTARKLSEIATGTTPLSNELKNRILTNLLAMMNLRESVERFKSAIVRSERRKTTSKDIAHRAYELYVQRGCEPGKDLEDWIRAENELSGED